MSAPDATAAARTTPRWLAAVILGLFGLLYAYAVWNAIGNLVAAVQTYSAAGVSLNLLGWFLWLFAAVFPIVVFALASWLARYQAILQRILVMLAGLALVAVFWLNVVTYALMNTRALVS